MIHVKTPATSANMGPGFDAIGMSFELYNNIWVCESDKKLEIECKNDVTGKVPKDETNLIYSSFVKFYEEAGIKNIPGIKIIQEDYIPMTRGLGSSAACIISGLLAANEMSGVKLSRDALAFLASKIEGHPDNAAPAILGGVIVGVLTESKLEYIKIENDFVKNLNYAVMIPSFPLSTEKARNILPKTIPLSNGIFNASRTGLMVAALLTGASDKLMNAMDDSFHQPYRRTIIDGMDEIFDKSKQLGAVSVFLSGAGPTIIALTQDSSFIEKITPFLHTLQHKWDISYIKPDFAGAIVSIK